MNKPIVINLYGGPGSGKSTTRAGIFSLLKLHGINAEEAPEYAKELTWEQRTETLQDQYYVWGKQYHRLFRLKKDVDVIITDSPILLSLIYASDANPCFHEMVIQSYLEYFNVNFFLRRVKKFNPKGRNQTEPEARGLDTLIKEMLDKYMIRYDEVEADFMAVNKIAGNIIESVFGIEQKIFFSQKSD